METHRGPVDLSIVVPCYNSGEWLGTLVDRLRPVLDDLGRSHELILVNDASPDSRTWATIEKLATSYEWVTGIDLMANVGQFRALLAGLEAATGRLVVTMDDDLQHPPEEIPKLVDAIEADSQLQAVIGSYGDKRHSRLRNLGTRVVGGVYERTYGKPADLDTTSFRILRRPLVDALLAHRTAKPVIGALILESTDRIANVEVEHHERMRGRSGWTLRSLTGATVDNIVNASTVPLRIVSGAGILIALFAFALGTFYFVKGLLGGTSVAGFTTLVVLVIFFGGAILAAVGLVGEYVARVVAEVRGAPRHTVRKRIN